VVGQGTPTPMGGRKVGRERERKKEREGEKEHR